jgi:hypothetical protein
MLNELLRTCWASAKDVNCFENRQKIRVNLQNFSGGRDCEVLVQLCDQLRVSFALLAEQVELLLLVTEIEI